MNKNKQNLISYKYKFETSLKQNENEVEQLLKAFVKWSEERINK